MTGSHRSSLSWWQRHPTGPTLATGAAVVALAVLGVCLRLWLLAHDPIDADQAVVGLMAQAIDHGHFPAFYWGQDYGGVEPYVTAVGVAVLGLHPWVVDGTPALLAAVSAVVAWRLGRALTGSTGAGAVAGALTWAWSETVVWNSTREYGFRGVTLLCLLTVALATVRLLQADAAAAAAGTDAGSPAAVSGARRWWPWILLGGAAGLGWWASPEILYVALPALPAACRVAVRSVRRRGIVALRPVLAGVAAAAVTLLPWLVASVHDGFASLSVANADQTAGDLGYLGRLRVCFTHTLPMALGARLPVSGAWLGGRAVGLVLLAVAVVVLGAGAAVAAWRLPAARVLVAAVVLYPFIEAAMGPTFFWEDGRYGVYLPPLALVAAVAGGAVAVRGARSPRRLAPAVDMWLAPAAGVLLCALSATSAVAGLDAATAVPGLGADSGFAASPMVLTGDPDTIAESVDRALLAHGLTHVYADYWSAYDLDVLAGERVLATPPDIVRAPALARAVERAKTAGWLFVGPTPTDVDQCAEQFQNPSPQPYGLTAGQFTTMLSANGIAATTVPVGPMVAVVPAVNVPPGWVVQHLRQA